MKKIALLFVVLSLAGVGFASPAQDRKEVRNFLEARDRWGSGQSNKEAKVEELKHLGDNAFPLLAEYLTDYELGYDAANVMMELDMQKSAPLLFHSMPKSDRNVQRRTFDCYIRHIRSGHPFAYSRDMHDAAVRCLKDNTPTDAAESALLAIGLTGSSNDFPLLAKYFDNKFSIEAWQWKMRHAAGASLARLGSRKHLDNIADALRAAVPDEKSYEWAWELTQYMREAAFSNNKMFIPLLGRHLYTPTLQTSSDMRPNEPAQEAANALDQLINKAPPNNYASLDLWRKWWAKPANR